MITQNFINLMKCILSTAGSNMSYNVPIKNASGNTYYLNFRRYNGFPWSVTTSVSFYTQSSATGILLGSGTTEPTVNDYFLQNYITSGFSANVTTNAGVDNNGDVYTDFLITITNTGNSTITIGEIGYIQYLACASTVGSTSSSTSNFLLDRTVLSTPVEIAPGDYETIRYRLKTSIPS